MRQRDKVWRHQADMGQSLYARHMRISGDISRGVWSMPRRIDPRAFGLVIRHIAAAFGTKSVFMVSQVEARPHPWIKSHRADANYYDWIR